MRNQAQAGNPPRQRVSLEDKFAGSGYRPSGFDYMRLLLATAVIAMHSVSTSYGDQIANRIWDTPLVLPFQAILPMFFALSGFLVAGSMERCRTLISFLGLRVIRIYPALTVEVLLSALLIGPWLTVVPLSEYFTSASFFKYLVNVTGHIHYVLPGVFLDNPNPLIVNGQLWTVPFELACYITFAFLILIGARKQRAIVPLGACVIALGYTAYEALAAELGTGATLSAGPALVVAFLSGVSFYLYRRETGWSPLLFLVSVAVLLLGLWVGPYGRYLAAIAAGYVTVFLGLCNPARTRLIAGADYSYGMYLYGFVIQQMVMAVLPGAREWYWNILISIPLSAAFAAMSWHLVEKPALRLRGVVMRLEERLATRRATPAWSAALGQ